MPTTGDTLERRFEIAAGTSNDELERHEAAFGPEIDHLVAELVDGTPTHLRRVTLARIMSAATRELQVIKGINPEPDAAEDADVIARVEAMDAIHADPTLRDWRRPHFVDVAKDPRGEETMERGKRLRFGGKVLEFGAIKVRPVPVYRDRFAEQQARELAFELAQKARIAEAQAAVAAAEQALRDEQRSRATGKFGERHSHRKMTQLSNAVARARKNAPRIEAQASEALTTREYRKQKRGAAAIRAALDVPRPLIETYAPPFRMA